MSSTLATAALLFAFAALAAPALLAFARRSFGWRTATLYGGLVAALLGYHVGFGFGSWPSASAIAGSAAGDAPSGSACEQLMSAARRGGIVLEKPDGKRLVVAKTLWQQLPENVHTALTRCAETKDGAPSGEGKVEIVER